MCATRDQAFPKNSAPACSRNSRRRIRPPPAKKAAPAWVCTSPGGSSNICRDESAATRSPGRGRPSGSSCPPRPARPPLVRPPARDWGNHYQLRRRLPCPACTHYAAAVQDIEGSAGMRARKRRWQPYAAAVVLTLACVLLRIALAPWVGSRPFLLIFFLPIIVAAYSGGLLPGLLATALPAVAAVYVS